MKDDARSRYEHMWTTHKDKYYLAETSRSRPDPFDAAIVVRDGGSLVIDDKDGVYLEIILRMRDAGVEIVTLEEDMRRAEISNRKWLVRCVASKPQGFEDQTGSSIEFYVHAFTSASNGSSVIIDLI